MKYRIGNLRHLRCFVAVGEEQVPTLEADLVDAFRQGLRNLNYLEGKKIVIDYRWAEGRNNGFPALVAEAVRLKADVILTSGTPATLAAKEGTRTIPIVVAAMGDAAGGLRRGPSEVLLNKSIDLRSSQRKPKPRTREALFYEALFMARWLQSLFEKGL
jgi:ABC transporter substrate binding protein